MFPDYGLCRYVRLPRLMATVFLAVVTGMLVAQQFLECAFAGTVFSCCRGGGCRYLRLLARCWLGLRGLLRDCGRGLFFDCGCGLGLLGLWLLV